MGKAIRESSSGKRMEKSSIHIWSAYSLTERKDYYCLCTWTTFLERIVTHVFPDRQGDDIMLGISRARVDNDDEGQGHLKEECVLEQLEKKDLDRLEKDEDKDEERVESKKRIRKIIERQTEARVQVAAAQASRPRKKQPRKKAKSSDGNSRWQVAKIP